MKKIASLLFICFISINIYSQDSQQVSPQNSFTFGFLYGGGALLGADCEMLLTKQFGLQAGFGIMAIGGGLNYHFKPSVRSSFVSLQYWHQGFANSHTQSAIGPCYVYRSKKWFTFQIGLAKTLDKGPNWPEDKKHPPIILTYAIGAYIPW
ncbi:hypothetical protein DMA11_15760 [Marinilabiliaceae bacterium JC017]|nr:hypothetical protein DMA11_15760 [Marinilabiliaceae bacterium JC017]